MNHKKLYFAFIVLATFAVVLSSCKKKEKEEKGYLDGELAMHGQKSIIGPGETLNFTVDGLRNIEDKEVFYRWSISGQSKTDTVYFADGRWSHTFSDTLMTYTVSCYTSCEGYYSSSATAYITVVAPGPEGSIPEIHDIEAKGTVKDKDGFEYKYVQVGNLYWMTRNLGTTGSGIPYHESEIMNDITGRYYSYDEALTVCPEGWRLPTDSEWMSAAQTCTDSKLVEHEQWEGVAGGLMRYATFNGNDLWEFWPKVKVTNSTGIQALSLGFANMDNEQTTGFYEQATFWTADEYDSERAFVRYIVAAEPDVYCMAAHKKEFGASVRCVKDAE